MNTMVDPTDDSCNDKLKLINQAREKWNKRNPRQQRKLIDFDTLLNHFKECKTQNEIAIIFGVSRERIRQLYDEYFCEIFDGVEGKKRMVSAIQKRRTFSSRKIEEELFQTEPLKTVVGQAINAGHNVSCFPVRNSGLKVSPKKININNSGCLIKTVTSVFIPTGSKKTYAHSFIILDGKEKNPDFVIFYIKIKGYPQRIFIVPYDVIKYVCCNQKNKQKCLNIPTEKTQIYKNRFPKINWWEYENAWHLIPKQTNEPA